MGKINFVLTWIYFAVLIAASLGVIIWGNPAWNSYGTVLMMAGGMPVFWITSTVVFRRFSKAVKTDFNAIYNKHKSKNSDRIDPAEIKKHKLLTRFPDKLAMQYKFSVLCFWLGIISFGLSALSVLLLRFVVHQPEVHTITIG